MAFAAARQTGLPLGEINTTPLIDVMLVLLVMLIFTIPAANHSLDIDLPQLGARPPDIPRPDSNKVVVTASGGNPVERPGGRFAPAQRRPRRRRGR